MNTWMLLAQTAGDWTEETYGQLVGGIIAAVLVGFGIVKCARIMRRPTTSTLGVLALLLVFVAFLVNGLWTIFSKVTTLSPQLWVLNFVIALPVLLAALVIAIIALVEYEPQRLNQGRAQAIWALILSLISLTASSSNVVAALSALQDGTLVTQRPAGVPGEEAVRSDLNFALKPPDASWVPIEAAELAPKACVAFRRGSGDLYTAVVAEQILSLTDEGIEPYIRNVKGNIAKQTVKDQTQEIVKVGALDFTRLRSQLWNEQLKSGSTMEHWLATRNGYAWQIVVWGPAGSQALVAEHAQAMLKGFRVLDMDRVTKARDRAVDVDRPALGYSTKLADLGWRSSTLDDEDGSAKPAPAGFTVQSLSASFSITPYEHRMEGPPPPPEALARAFLAAQQFVYDRDSADFSTRTLSQPLPGLEITTEGVIGEEPSRCLYRVHQSGRWAWLLGGGVLKLKGTNLDRLRAACEAVTLKAPASPPAATTATPKPSAARLEADAEFINQIGLWYLDASKPGDAVRYFQESSRLRPASQTYFDNITYALEADGRAGEALTLMEAARDRSFADKPEHQFRHAWLRVKAGQAKEGATALARLIDEGFRDSDEILNSINLLLEQEHGNEARQVADAYAKANPIPKARLWQAQTANTAAAHDEAVKLLEQLIKDEPDYLPARYSLGVYSNRNGKYDRALEQAEFLEKEGQNTTQLYLMRGWAHMGRKWYKEAKASFEKAAKIDPEDEEVKSAIQEASAHLGQGSNLEIKTPIEAVPLPPRIASRLEDLRIGSADFGKGHNSARLLWSVAVRYTKDKPMRTTTRSVVRILNSEGAADFNTLQFNYDPLHERLFVNRVEVLDSAGRVTARAAADDSYVLDSRDRSMADTDRTVHVQVPGLKEGDILDYEVTIERLGLRKEFPLERNLFGSSLPCMLESYSISGDVASIQQDLLRGEKVKVTRENDSVVFETDHPPIFESEAYAQPADTWAPVLILSAKGKTWEEVGRDHLKEIAASLKPDPEIDAEAKRLTEGLQDTREKVRALTAFVQKSIRYKAIEFGVRGYVPDPPAEVLKQRYGDCKDQALLLHHLLRACGIESHLAMVDTNWELPLKQPSLDAFNHVIVHVPGLPMPGFIDTTASHIAAADNTPYGLWGQEAFILKPGKPVLQTIPGPAPDSGQVTSKRTLSLLPPDSLRVVEELTLTGYYASGMRGSFAPEEPKARFQHAQDLLDDLGNYRLQDFEFINLTDPNAPAILRFTYTMPNALETRGGATKLRLPAAWENDYLRIPFIKDRITPFRWQVPFHFRSQVTFDKSLPLDPESLAAMARKQESKFGAWEMKTPSAAGAAAGPALHFEITVTPGRHPATDYPLFQSLWSSALDTWSRELTLAKP